MKEEKKSVHLKEMISLINGVLRKFLRWPTEMMCQLTDFIFTTVVEIKKVQLLLGK